MPSSKPAHPEERRSCVSKELRRARLTASATKGLTVKPAAQGRLLWYWEPNRAEKAAGWKPLAFGPDKPAAQRGADARNAQVAAWRRGDPLPRSSPSTCDGEVAARSADGGVTLLPPAPAPKHAAFMTIADHAARYKEQYVAHLSAGHQRNVKSNLKFACAMFGDLLPGDIQPRHIADWTDSMRGRGKYTAAGRKVGDTTAHNRKRTFKALLAWIANPYAKFAQPRGRHQIWEADDRAAFVAAAYDLGLPNMALALELAFYTSQRTEDMLAFTEAQLTEMKHLLDPDVRAALADEHGKVWGWQFLQKKQKPDQAPVLMHIPFEPEMLAKLRRTIARNRAIDRAPKTNGAPPRLLTHILVNEEGGGAPWQYRHFNRAWNKVKDHAIERTGRTGMDELHWHDFRRSRCVELKRQGFSHDRIATLTGHDPETIDAMMEVYGPVDPNMTAALIVDSAQRSRKRSEG